MTNYRMLIMYDGSSFNGWQRLKNSSNTIQGKLEDVLSRYSGKTVSVSGSGRTDAGVHAAGQVCSFLLDEDRDCEDILLYLRHYLPESIGVMSVEKAEPGFHARLSAKKKTYCYRIWNSNTPCVFERKYVYVFPAKLNFDAMLKAAGQLCGTHDFAAFTSQKGKKKSTVRTICSLEISRTGEEIVFLITADGFLYNMVRIIIGTLLEIGRGDRMPDCIAGLLQTGIRQDSGFTVPARGLILKEVFY